MIIKGGSRSGRASYITYLARHLLRADTNEVVNVLEVRGTVAIDLRGAMREMSALGLCATSARPLYHANIDPGPDEPPLADQQKFYAIDRLEIELGFVKQPRIIVEHIKNGRPHLHSVWSRIDVGRARVISDSHNYLRHEVVARDLEATFGHRRIQGAHIGRGDLPRPARAPSDIEVRQAERSGLSPEQATDLVNGLWHTTDSGRAFVAAIEAQGWACVRGDRRDFVLLDPTGETHSLVRRVRGAKAQDVRERMADVDPADLQSVEASRAIVRARKQQDEEPAISPPLANARQTAGSAVNDAMKERKEVQASGVGLIEGGRGNQEISAFNADVVAHKAAVARYRVSIKRAERRHGRGRDTESPGAAAIPTREPARSINQSGGAIDTALRQIGPSFRERREASDRRMEAGRATLSLAGLRSPPRSDAIALAVAELDSSSEALIARVRRATGRVGDMELRCDVNGIGMREVTPVLIRLDRLGLKIPPKRAGSQRIYRVTEEFIVMALGRSSIEDREDLLRLLPGAVSASLKLRREAEDRAAAAAIRARLAEEAAALPPLSDTSVPGVPFRPTNSSRSAAQPIHGKPGSPADAPTVVNEDQGRAGSRGNFLLDAPRKAAAPGTRPVLTPQPSAQVNPPPPRPLSADAGRPVARPAETALRDFGAMAVQQLAAEGQKFVQWAAEWTLAVLKGSPSRAKISAAWEHAFAPEKVRWAKELIRKWAEPNRVGVETWANAVDRLPHAELHRAWAAANRENQKRSGRGM